VNDLAPSTPLGLVNSFLAPEDPLNDRPHPSVMSLIGFRRQEGEIEYLEEVEYSEEHLEDDLTVIHSDQG